MDFYPIPVFIFINDKDFVSAVFELPHLKKVTKRISRKTGSFVKGIANQARFPL